MAFIEPMHRNKPNITYLLIHDVQWQLADDNFILDISAVKYKNEAWKLLI